MSRGLSATLVENYQLNFMKVGRGEVQETPEKERKKKVWCISRPLCLKVENSSLMEDVLSKCFFKITVALHWGSYCLNHMNQTVKLSGQLLGCYFRKVSKVP